MVDETPAIRKTFGITRQNVKTSSGPEPETYTGTVIIEMGKDPLGTLRIKFEYMQGPFLGKGGFARVYALKCRQECRTYAAKFILKSTLTKKSRLKKLS